MDLHIWTEMNAMIRTHSDNLMLAGPLLVVVLIHDPSLYITRQIELAAT
jgi:hypothetical protein